MFYEFIIKIVGFSILTSLWFHPVSLITKDNSLLVQTTLNEPITAEIKRLVDQGLLFEVVYIVTVKVNKQTLDYITVRKKLIEKDHHYYVNNDYIPTDQLQNVMGDVDIVLKGIDLQKEDTIQVTVRGVISENTDFQNATHLKASTLWNYHQPIITQSYRFDGKGLITLDER